AENAGGEKQPPMLRRATLEGEISEQESHDERAAHVLDHGSVVEAGAEPARPREIDPVAQRGADAATEENNQKAHLCSSFPGNKKTALRRSMDGVLPPLLRGRSHQPLRAVPGDSIPTDANTLAAVVQTVNARRRRVPLRRVRPVDATFPGTK